MRFYFDLFLSFFKIGLFTIGGGYVMIPLLREECVRKKKWFSEEEFVDIITISQSTPGVLAINMSIFIGYKLKKLKGALITTLGTILPSFIIILLFAIFLAKYGELKIIQKIFKAIRPVVVALIVYAVYTMARVAKLNWYTIWIPIIVFALIIFAHISPVYIIMATIITAITYSVYIKHVKKDPKKDL